MKILLIGQTILRRKIKQVSAKEIKSGRFQSLIRTMTRTMRQAQGVGLAANQVRIDQHVMVLESHRNKRYPQRSEFPLKSYVNLKILKRSKEKERDWEGCLSIPHYRGLVPRAKEIWIKALTPTGDVICRHVSGFEARVIQHEFDHLNGTFYVDRMPDLQTWKHWEL